MEETEVARVKQKFEQTKAREMEALRTRLADEEKRKMRELDEEEQRMNAYSADDGS